MYFGVVTLFPSMFDAITEYGVTRRASVNSLIKVECTNPRDYTEDKFGNVDDKPYGGGPGMLMQVQPLRDALKVARAKAPKNTKVVYMSPQGIQLNHSLVTDIHSWGSVILLSGRYEGIDERVLQKEVDLEVSIGDYVLSGGELPAMCIIDAVSRMVPGVLGNIQNAKEDSFAQGLLHYPQFTRPEEIDGMKVPEILLSGDHAKIKEWRLKQSLGRTMKRRPDLLKERVLTEHEQQLLHEYMLEHSQE